MRNSKSNQKLVLAGLLMTLLSLNISWDEYLGFQFGQSDDLASKGLVLSDSQKNTLSEKAVKVCQNIDGSEFSEATALFNSGSYLTELSQDYEIEEDGETEKKTKTYYSQATINERQLLRCKNGMPYKRSDGSSNKNCREIDIAPNKTIKRLLVTVDISDTPFHGTEARLNALCNGNCGPSIIDFLDVEDSNRSATFEVETTDNMGDERDKVELIRDLCIKYHKYRSIQYHEAGLRLQAKAKDDLALEELDEKLEELKDECKVEEHVDGRDVWKVVGKDHDDNMKHLKSLSGIDFLTGEAADDDLEDLVEKIAMTDKDDILRCHRKQVRSKDGKEAKAKYVHKMLKNYREMMISDDEDIRELAYQQIEFLRGKKYGLNGNMKKFLRTEKDRAEATHKYKKRIEKIENHFQKQLDRVDDGTTDGALMARSIRENMRLAKLQAQSHYQSSVQRTFSGWPRGNDDVVASYDFWDDHIDNVINGIDDDGSLFDGSLVEGIDFAGRFDSDNYVRNRSRTGRWDDQIGFRLDAFNNESRRIDFNREIADTLDQFRRGLDGISPLRNNSTRLSNLGTANRFAPPSSGSSFGRAVNRGRGLVRARHL